MEHIKYRYSALYKDITEFPELGKFRRYTEEWAWMLYDASAEIRQLRQECDDDIATIRKREGMAGMVTVTDVHQAGIRNKHPELSKKLESLKEKIRKYSKNLCLAHAVAQLPDQPNVFAKHLAEKPGLLEDDLFGPTGESAVFYKVPSHPDTCGLKGMSQEDISTEFIIDNIRSMNEHVVRWIPCFGKEEENDPERPVQTSIELDTIRKTINVLTSLYIPVFFTASMVIIVSISSIKVAFAVALVLGLVVTASVLLVVPNITRGELFVITASFYAIVGIFIDATKGISGGK